MLSLILTVHCCRRCCCCCYPRKWRQYCFQRRRKVFLRCHDNVWTAWWNFARACTLTSSRTLLIECQGYRSTFKVMSVFVRFLSACYPRAMPGSGRRRRCKSFILGNPHNWRTRNSSLSRDLPWTLTCPWLSFLAADKVINQFDIWVSSHRTTTTATRQPFNTSGRINSS